MAESGKAGMSYASSSESPAETLEKLGRKVANEVRYRVRRFTHAEPLTGPWLELLEPLKFLAAVAEKEDEHCRQAVASPTAGKETTVWEREEVCVRIIVEEGKINLMARCLREIKELEYSGGIPSEVLSHAKAYEESLGCVVRCALVAIECLQTLDLRSLLEHCALCLNRALKDDVTINPSDCALQEVLVIRYLHLIFSRIDRLQPDVLVDKVTELGIVPLVLRHLEKHRKVVDAATHDSYLFFFVHLVETEFFKTNVASFFATKEEKKSFAVKMDSLVAAYAAQGPERKKAVRPLSDLVIRWK